MVLISLLVLAASQPAGAQPAAPGRGLYSSYCADCHGANGEGARGPSLKRPRLPRASTEQALTMVILNGIPNTAMPPTRLFGDELRLLAAYVRSLANQPREPLPGNPALGEAVFRGKGGCLRCHMVGGEGARMGPELTRIGAIRGAAHLRQSILEPEAETPNSFAQYRIVIPLPDNFLMVELRTKDGRTIRGVRLNEDPFSIQIRGLDDRLESFLKSELAELIRQPGASPMPSYRNTLGARELDDLISYLLTLTEE